MPMSYQVMAGYVSVETQINDNGGRAVVDIPRGADLPGDVPQEQVDTLLRLGRIKETTSEPESEPEVAPDSEPAEVEEDPEDGADETSELDGLEKDDLLKIAADEDVDVDKRWGVEKLAAAIREHRQ